MKCLQADTKAVRLISRRSSRVSKDLSFNLDPGYVSIIRSQKKLWHIRLLLLLRVFFFAPWWQENKNKRPLNKADQLRSCDSANAWEPGHSLAWGPDPPDCLISQVVFSLWSFKNEFIALISRWISSNAWVIAGGWDTAEPVVVGVHDLLSHVYLDNLRPAIFIS